MKVKVSARWHQLDPYYYFLFLCGERIPYEFYKKDGPTSNMDCYPTVWVTIIEKIIRAFKRYCYENKLIDFGLLKKAFIGSLTEIWEEHKSLKNISEDTIFSRLTKF